MFVEAVLERFPTLPIDLATGRAHARIRIELAARGDLIGSHALSVRSPIMSLHDGGPTPVPEAAADPSQVRP